ncbi:acyl carrier protein [Pseudovibrio sp. W64]|uniref:acyl carrier protein n=1 Tax=Pseudovibrio TaxID=258255 RepID=UPI0007AE85D3|nr:acyl carrier protein [Pseudovibrio sp. W64]KZK81526.1 acyl carrier protein [Pseudovibrio sp. W64]
MNVEIKNQIVAALSEVLERPVPDLQPETRFDLDFDLDSYIFVQFLLALEDRIPGLRFDPDAIGQHEFNVVSSLVDYIEQRTELVAEPEHA